MIRYALALLLLLVAAVVPVEAGGYYYPSYYGYSYVYPYVQPYYPPVEVKHITVLDYEPPYAVGYARKYVAPPEKESGPSCEEKHKELAAKLELLTAKLAALQAQPQTYAPQPPPMAPVSESLVVQKCAACHDAQTSAEKGAGVTLTAAGRVPWLTLDVAGRSCRYVVQKKCPKDKPLSDAESAAVIRELMEHVK